MEESAICPRVPREYLQLPESLEFSDVSGEDRQIVVDAGSRDEEIVAADSPACSFELTPDPAMDLGGLPIEGQDLHVLQTTENELPAASSSRIRLCPMHPVEELRDGNRGDEGRLSRQAAEALLRDRKSPWQGSLEINEDTRIDQESHRLSD